MYLKLFDLIKNISVVFVVLLFVSSNVFADKDYSYPFIIKQIIHLFGGEVESQILLRIINEEYSLGTNEYDQIISELENVDVMKSSIAGAAVQNIIKIKKNEHLTLSENAVHIVESGLLNIMEKNWEDLIAYTINKPYLIKYLEKYLQNRYRKGYVSKALILLEIHLLEYYMYAIRDHASAGKLITLIDKHIQSGLISKTSRSIYISSRSNFLVSNFSKDRIVVHKAISDMNDNLKYIEEVVSNKDELIRYLSCFAQIYILQGNIEMANYYIEKAEKVLPKVEKNRYRALFYFIKSWVKRDMGFYEEALFFADMSIQELSKSPNTPLKYFCINRKADNLNFIGKFEEGLSLAREASNMAQNTKDIPSDWRAESFLIESESL